MTEQCYFVKCIIKKTNDVYQWIVTSEPEFVLSALLGSLYNNGYKSHVETLNDIDILNIVKL